MNRRLLFGIILVILFSIVVIVWYFVYATPSKTPSLGKTNNPLSSVSFPKGFQFILGDGGIPPLSSTSTTEVTPEALRSLSEVWNKPTAGNTFVSKEVLKEIDVASKTGTSTVKRTVRATSTVLMFVDRMTGYVYVYQPDDGNVYQVSNTTIPGVYDAYIFNNGKSLILRYVDTASEMITSILANIPPTQPSSPALPLENIKYLPTRTTSLSVNKKGDRVSYLVLNNSGSSIYTLTTKGTSLVASSPFGNWSIFYGGETLYATSKPSAYAEGITVRLPSFDYVLGGKTGLMSNPSEKGLFFNSMWSSRGLVSFLSTNQSQITLPVSTISSKCIWGQKEYLLCAVPKTLPRSTEGLPDDWFQGRFLFNDSLFIVDPSSGSSFPLYSFDSSLGDFDVTFPSLSSDNALFSFIRKQDNTLWLLRINLAEEE